MLESVRSRRLSRFAVIGIAATLLHACMAFALFHRIGPPVFTAVTASLAACATAAVLSYVGHKYFTFVSGGDHRVEIPRFAVTTALGLVISYALPAFLVGALGLSFAVTIVATCAIIPAVNYLALGGWVFAPAGGIEPMARTGKQANPAPALRTAIAALSALIVFASVVDNAFFNYTHMDISWLLTVADRMIAGEKLYVDIWETNPPFSVFLYFPSAYIAHVTGLKAEFFVACSAYLWALGCLLVCFAIVRKTKLLPFTDALWLLPVTLALVLIVLPATFAQREYFGILAALPMILVAAARLSRSARIPIPLLITVGVLAAVTMAVKPHYAAAFAAPYLYAAAVRRSWRIVVSLEIVAAALLTLTYAGAVLIFYREFLTEVTPILMDVYVSRRTTLAGLLSGFGAIGLMMGVVYLFLVPRLGKDHSCRSMALAFAAFFLAFLVQGKGWDYHALPFVVMGGLAVALAWMASRQVRSGGSTPGVARLLVIVLAASLGTTAAKTFDRGAPNAELLGMLRAEGKQVSVAVIGADIGLGHPFTRIIDGHWVGRDCSDWLGAYAQERLHSDASLTVAHRERLSRYVAEAIARKAWDLNVEQPDIVIVDRAATHWARHLSQNPRISAVLGNYEEIAGKDRRVQYLSRRDDL